MTPDELVSLERRLAVERIALYRSVAGDLRSAIRLYEWNREVAGAFAVTLGDVEVILRNALHDQLTAWSRRKFGQAAWYQDPGATLTPAAIDEINIARRRAAGAGYAVTPGRVVAELSLGFWRYLLASRYERLL